MKAIIYQQVTVFALRFLLCGAAGLLFSIINLVLQPFVFAEQTQLIDDVPILLYLPMIPGIIAWHLVSEAIARSQRFNHYHERLFVIIWSAMTVLWLIADYFPTLDLAIKSYVVVANIFMAWLAVEASLLLFRLIGVRSR